MTKTLQHYLDRFLLLQLAAAPGSVDAIQEALDEAVHDYFSGQAANVNNEGLESQDEAVHEDFSSQGASVNNRGAISQISFIHQYIGAEKLDQIFASVKEDGESAAASEEISYKIPKIIAEMIQMMGDQYYSRTHLANPKTDRHGWANHVLMSITALESGQPRNALYFMVDLLDRILTTEIWSNPKRQEAEALEAYMPPLRRIGRDCYTLADTENVFVRIPHGDRFVDVVIIQGESPSIGVWADGDEVGERRLIQSVELGGALDDPGAA